MTRTAPTTPGSRFLTGWRGADYEGLTVDDTVAVTIDDDDEPGIVVAGLEEVTEGGDVELSVTLNTLPTGNVTVTLTVPAELTAELLDGLVAAHLHHRQLVDGPDGDGDRAR